ncbi:hypothetical protein GGR50DRAFT_698989 [Xylaria sp. CBS 124048]|nr:hypothetical protein GGR50DRAFT_698989 [Xylaria sp. CBS 124048]
MSPPTPTDDDNAHVGTDRSGARPLYFWSYEGRVLVAPEHADNEDDCDNKIPRFNDPFQLTCFVMDYLRKSNIAAVRAITDCNPVSKLKLKATSVNAHLLQNIKRLLEVRNTRNDAANVVPTPINVSTEQSITAVAAHLCLAKINNHDCGTCDQFMSPKMFKKCVSFGDAYFRGACSSCAYNSAGFTCSFHVDNMGTDYAEMSRADIATTAALVTMQLMQSTPTEHVRSLSQMVNYELSRRLDLARARAIGDMADDSASSEES